MTVKTDIRTGQPVWSAPSPEDPKELERKAALRGVSDTPQADLLRKLVMGEMIARIRVILESDDTVAAMQSLLRRMELAEMSAEEAAHRLMGISR